MVVNLVVLLCNILAFVSEEQRQSQCLNGMCFVLKLEVGIHNYLVIRCNNNNIGEAGSEDE